MNSSPNLAATTAEAARPRRAFNPRYSSLDHSRGLAAMAFHGFGGAGLFYRACEAPMERRGNRLR